MDWQTWFQDFLAKTLEFIPRLVLALAIFFASLPLAGLAARWIKRVAKLRTADEETLQLLSRLARWSVVILGTVIALDQVNFDVTGFVAGLGIVGLTIGFALQDIARNFVAGILLLMRQPFSIGDAVKVSDYSGEVLEISVRDTVIKTWDGEKVILPNKDVFTSAITNYSELPLRRRTVHIGIGYGQDFERATAVFLEAIQQVEGVLADPAPTVQAEELGDSAVVAAARFWVNQETHGLFDVHSQVVWAIQDVAEKEGIDLPYPIQTVRLEGGLGSNTAAAIPGR